MRSLKRMMFAVSGLLLVVGVIISQQIVQAATGSLYLSPTSTTVQKGSTVSVAVRINPGTAIDTVYAVVGFDAAKLSYQGISYAGSPFDFQAPGQVTSTSVTLTEARTGGTVTTDSLAATLSFKALVGGVNATISLSGNAALAGTPTNPAAQGTTLTLTNPVTPTCPVGQQGIPPNCVTPVVPVPPVTVTPTPPKPAQGGSTPVAAQPTTTTPPAASPAGDTTPVIDQQDVQFTLVNMTISSKTAAQAYIRYGLSKTELTNQTPLDAAATQHHIALDPASIIPGQIYYFQVYSVDSQNQTTQSDVLMFTAKGLSAKLSVFDKNHKPLKGRNVTIHSAAQTARTDGDGAVSFANLSPGTHTLSYTTNGHTYSQTVQLANNIVTVDGVQKADVQSFSVVYDFKQAGLLQHWLFLAPIVLLLAFMGLVVIRKKRSNSGGIYPSSGLTAAPVTMSSTPLTPEAQQTENLLQAIPAPPSTTPGTVIQANNVNKDKEL